MTGQTAKLIDVLLCDDVRQEASGKLVVVGMYLGDVVVFGLPTSLPSFTFVCKWDTSVGALPAGEYAVVAPSGTVLQRVEAKGQTTAPPRRIALGILQFHAFRFPEVGMYRLSWKPTGGRSRVLTEFPVELHREGAESRPTRPAAKQA